VVQRKIEINEQAVKDFLIHLRIKEYSELTLNINVSALKLFFKFSRQSKIMDNINYYKTSTEIEQKIQEKTSLDNKLNGYGYRTSPFE